jgi:hypothetical protein
MASRRLRVWRREWGTGVGQKSRPSAHDALESIVDGCKVYSQYPVAANILAYYRSTSETALERLINEVDRRGQP